ncbi:exopolyphosphatase [Buchananella hordeovulneris]|uniref:Exopolyphosphatase n=1 Tax=Buchananella hordeovulneris TaxID=52770 RepID=A0A1Q5PYL4_9ACTO|nr:exopolyphosphatase [Buchananella hordeovulneris]OKL52713.1 exopolyphosphatase [Buchananella hordeovulneris]
MKRVAVIDCGTNSIRLLIGDLTPHGLVDIERQMRVVRLGHGVDATGRLDPQALARTIAATRDYAELAARHGASARRFVATSATRDADNRDLFVQAVTDVWGTAPEVISGQEEAELSYRGATAGLADGGQTTVVDIGGGSTELVRGRGRVEAARSLDVGCVRLTERHLAASLDAAGRPSAAALAAARADVRALLAPAVADLALARTQTLIGLAGTITTVTAHALGLPAYDPGAIHGARLPVAQALAACAKLIEATRADKEAMGFMHPGRVDVIAAGCVVWSEVITAVAEAVAATGQELTHVRTSEHDILDGIALSLA